jgi:glycosyltransferase involved in cell wall biosynthesis
VTGYVVQERTPEAFAQPIIHLLQRDGERVTMGEASLARCRQLFDLPAATRDLETYYTRLLDRP